jgi:tetratricopeptide (TPR) repeat protein
MASPLRDVRTAYLLVGLIATLVYANALPNQFAYDDQHIVVTNTAIQSAATLPGALVVPYWPNAYGSEMGLWRPVTTALLGVQYIVGGGAPLVFHAVNVLMHALASLLVLALLLEIMSMGAALAGALVFAVHPVHVEAIANVIGLSEIVSTVAVLGACLVHVRSRGASRWRDAFAVAVLYAVGFGAKESAVTLPGLIFLLDAAREDISFRQIPDYLRRRWRVYLGLALVAASMLVLRFAVLGSVASPLAPVGADLLTQIPRIWTLGTVWTQYVRLWVFPLDLSADYSPGVIPISIGWGVENGLGVALALLILVATFVAWSRPHLLRGRNTARAAAFGVLWFIIAISPTSNTVFLSGVLLAERTLYLPSVGLAAGTGWLIMRLARERPRGAWVALAVMLILSSVRTWTRNPTWHDNATMLTTLVRDYPQAGRSQWVLGDVLLGRGRVSEALRSYRAAINLLGTHYQLMTEISKQLIDEQRYRAAERLLEIAWEETPRFPLAPGLLALTRAEHGDAVATEQWARRSLALEDVDPTRHHLLAWALAAQGRFPEAAESRRRADDQGRAYFWQQYMYLAYVRRAAGDTVGAHAAVDTAWSRAFTVAGRAALDSVRVTEFGLETVLGAGQQVQSVGPARSP